MQELVSAFLVIVGAVFMLLAGVGILRMPDLFLRMSATTKASTLGGVSMLLALAIYFGDLGIASRAVATMAFLLITAPVAAHLIGRAAYLSDVSLCDTTVVDHLHGRYDAGTHDLDSHPCGAIESAPQPEARTEPQRQ